MSYVPAKDINALQLTMYYRYYTQLAVVCVCGAGNQHVPAFYGF
jgi:hypothetical protein